MSIAPDERKRLTERFLRRISELRLPPEQVAERLAAVPPFDYEAWAAEMGPASAEELAEMEEFLAERERERALPAEP
jgi:hypothetical protein